MDFRKESRSALMGDEVDQLRAQLVAGLAKGGETLFVRTAGEGRIVNAPMYSLGFAGEHGTRLIRVVADGDDEIEGRGEEFVERF